MPIGSWAWNNEHGRLSAREAAEPGPWMGAKTPYWEHWHDIASARLLGPGFLGDRDPLAHRTEQIWLVKGTQMGGTRSFLLALIGWLAARHPAPMGYFLPRKEDFAKVQSDRLLPFFEECPQLDRLLPQGVDARRLNITQESWRLLASTIYYLNSSNAKDLRSKPLAYGAWDEFDQSPLFIEREGDPIALGLARHATFKRTGLAFGITTPTEVDRHGWRRLCMGSHERLLIRCPHCQADQELHPDRLRIVDGDGTILTIPEAAKAGLEAEVVKMRRWGRWRCANSACEALIEQHRKDRLVADACAARRWVPGTWRMDEQHPQGAWIPRADFAAGMRLLRAHPIETTIRTGHINSLYSPFMTLHEFAANALAATYGTAADRAAHTNTFRAEPTVPTPAAPPVPLAAITTRAEFPRGAGPVCIQRIITNADQQGSSRASSWFPYVVRGWAAHGATYLLAEGIAKDWDALAELEMTPWMIGGKPRLTDVMTLDGANGPMQVHVQAWAQANATTRLVLNGRDNLSDLVRQRSNQGRTKRRTASNVRWYYYNVDAWKNTFADRLESAAAGIVRPGVPAWHLHHAPEPAYLASLHSEMPVRILDRRGQPRIVWRPRMMINRNGQEVEREDTHWLDCEVHQLVTARIMGWDDLPEPEPDTTTDPEPADAGGDWVGAPSSW